MTTIATVVASSWSISIGGGWIVLVLVWMGLCFAFMLVSMWLTPYGHGWPMCGRRGQQQTPPDASTAVSRQRPDRSVSPEAEARP